MLPPPIPPGPTPPLPQRISKQHRGEAAPPAQAGTCVLEGKGFAKVEVERNWGVGPSGRGPGATLDLLETALEEEEVTATATAKSGSRLESGVRSGGRVTVWVIARAQGMQHAPWTDPPGPPFPC